jgi:hypothetical protein
MGLVADAVRRGRRRKVVSAAAGIATAVVVVGVSVSPFLGLRSGDHLAAAPGQASITSPVSTSQVGPSPSSAGSSTAAPSVSQPAVGGSASSSAQAAFQTCTTDRVRATLTAGGSVASQPYAAVALTNTGTSPCTLRGYPVVTFTSATGNGIATTASHGSTYEVSDPGPTDVTIGPGDSAHFTLGTGTAAGGPEVAMAYALVSWGSGSPVRVRVDLAGSAARNGDPIPVTITAFALGAKQAGLAP